MDKKEALENLDLILLCLDEIVDGGYAMCFLFKQYIIALFPLCAITRSQNNSHVLCSIILETDANIIAGKVASNSLDAGAPLSEQVL